MPSWFSIAKNELHLILKDKSILLTCLVAPLLYAIFIGSIYKNKEVNQIPTAIVDLDKTSISRKIGYLLNAHEKISIHGNYSTFEEAQESFRKLEVQGIVIIPKGFENRTLNLEGSTVSLILNNTKFLTSNEINKGVQETILTVSGGVRMQYLLYQKIPAQLAKEQAQPILPVIKPIYNPTNNYGDYLLPILLVLILQQTLIIGFGQSVVHAFREGELARPNNLQISGYLKVLTAKSFYYLILYTVYFLVFFEIIFPYYHLTFSGPLYLLLLICFLFLTSVILFTILLASFFKTTIGWTEILAFSTYPLFLVSGYSWPISAMPMLLRGFANMLPATPFYSVFTKLSLNGVGFSFIREETMHLLLIIFISYLVLLVRLSYLNKKGTEIVVE